MWQTAVVVAVVVLAAVYVVWRLRRTVTRRETSCCDLGDDGRCPLQSNGGPARPPGSDDACDQCRLRRD